jgi:hypothetical protein
MAPARAAPFDARAADASTPESLRRNQSAGRGLAGVAQRGEDPGLRGQNALPTAV